MGELADTVLRAVSADWLRFVPVEMGAAASFGGPGLDPGQGESRKCKPDHVMLRAVGLVVLKSLELALQTGAGTIIAFIVVSLVMLLATVGDSLWLLFLHSMKVNRLTDDEQPANIILFILED